MICSERKRVDKVSTRLNKLLLQNTEIKLNIFKSYRWYKCHLTCSTCSCSLGVRVMATSSLFSVPTGFSILGSDLGFRLKKLRKLRACDCCLGLFIVQSWTVQPTQHERVELLLFVCLCLLLYGLMLNIGKQTIVRKYENRPQQRFLTKVIFVFFSHEMFYAPLVIQTNHRRS